MAGFNELLVRANIPPSKTRLVRHQSSKLPAGPYGLWATDRAAFELYQQAQSKLRFKGAEFVASFVATPAGDTLFVGMYAVHGAGPADPDLHDPLAGHSLEDHFLYQLELLPELADLRGRLIVDWGPGARSWVQHAEEYDKPVLSALEVEYPADQATLDRLKADRDRIGRDPDWAREEHVLALHLYLQNPMAPPGKESAAVIELSELLGRLGVRLRVRTSDKYRNANGVYMKLMNFRRLDPAFLAQGKKGLTRGAKGEKEVWDEFAGNPAGLAAEAAAIRLAIGDPAVDLSRAADDYEAEEWGYVVKLHRSRERSRELIRRKKAHELAANGRLICEVCDFDFGTRYGSLGKDFIEAHHRKPVSALEPGEKTKLEDLALVCSNCHRMLHRSRLSMSLADLRALLKSGEGISAIDCTKIR